MISNTSVEVKNSFPHVCSFALAGNIGIYIMFEVLRNAVQCDTASEKWTKGITVPLYKGEGDPLDCGKYRGLILLEHEMKIWESVLMKKLERYLHIHELQLCFAQGKSMTDAIFVVRQLQEKQIEKKQKLYLVCVDLEKSFDKVPRHITLWAL